MTTFSPNVIAREFDFSDYAVRASTAILGVVGFCRKGPVGVPIYISNEQQLVTTFGTPEVEVSGLDYVTKNMILPCLQYLREGNQMLVVRANSGANTASFTVIDDNVGADFLGVSAVSPGTWPSDENISITISEGSAGGDYFKLDVLVAGVVTERYDNITLNSGDETNWPSARINGKSFVITVTEAATPTSSPELPVFDNYSLSGGTNGTSDIADMTAALTQFEDPDTVTINLLITPGAAREISDTNQEVARAALQICERRGDAFYIMDHLYALTTPSSVKDSVNGANGNEYGAAFNSSYGAIYAPWLQTYDTYNRKTVWCPPCGFIAGQYAYNDRVSQAWFAAAGLTRGKIRLASATKFGFTRGDLELVQAPREIVNPIRNITGEGITVWGQRTMQRRSSALDRVNVRRMLNYAKATVIGATRVLLFEPNDSKTWRRFSQLVTPVIQNIKDTRGVYDFRVICDASTNPPDLVDQNKMAGKILLKPTKTAEIITVDFNILSTGASFSEFI